MSDAGHRGGEGKAHLACAHSQGGGRGGGEESPFLVLPFFFIPSLRTKPLNDNLPRFGKMALIPCSLEHFYGPFQAGM